jgi:hypothetical protein
MLEASKKNSSLTNESSSIRLLNEGRIWFSSLSLKLVEMAKASRRSQRTHEWLRTHANTIGEKQSTIVWEIYHVKGGGAQTNNPHKSLFTLTKHNGRSNL